ncbi:uncharacterized protein VICG_00403 [Vittaforma corneae ATCC 50505]|uniref:U3 small nucleolar RNA-associated protein 6 N-terminal domain-containing protein n=1 Tax=Vittaforma corneae (strain ATCC 50505) TaxID=993615 RepID=L2GPA1_VITCO|nr:uncharacterized protein VICG_00403 [Vittaforma corneae ATCC 50505]ELA42651.1 hypothetical protein VICG_00403 [Vittaforma corneae ATCC 50505]
MIDRVQKVLEWMAPELESYKKRRIFSQKQIQKIVENRRRFENKLQRSSKKLLDFLTYIDSEKNLEKIRNKKIAALGTGLEDTDMLLQANIIKIYERALHYYSEPILLKDFSEYCIRRKAFEEMKSTFAAKCLKNLTNTDLWVYCAQKLWEIDDIEGARGLFIKGASVNSDSKLCVEFFRLECLYANKLNRINQELGVADEDKDEIEKGKIALTVFENLKERMAEHEINQCMEISSIVSGLNEQLQKLI